MKTVRSAQRFWRSLFSSDDHFLCLRPVYGKIQIIEVLVIVLSRYLRKYLFDAGRFLCRVRDFRW